MIVAIYMFGMTLVIPVMTLFTQYLGAISFICLLYALYSRDAFASSLFLGRISDIVGHRKAVLWTLTGAIFGTLEKESFVCLILLTKFFALIFGLRGSKGSSSFHAFVIWRLLAGVLHFRYLSC